MSLSFHRVQRHRAYHFCSVFGKIFAYAHTIAPCLIFIDEVEEILGSNSELTISAAEGIYANIQDTES